MISFESYQFEASAMKICQPTYQKVDLPETKVSIDREGVMPEQLSIMINVMRGIAQRMIVDARDENYAG